MKTDSRHQIKHTWRIQQRNTSLTSVSEHQCKIPHANSDNMASLRQIWQRGLSLSLFSPVGPPSLTWALGYASVGWQKSRFLWPWCVFPAACGCCAAARWLYPLPGSHTRSETAWSWTFWRYIPAWHKKHLIAITLITYCGGAFYYITLSS